MPRMRMRPWLETMIESNSVQGLTWVNEEKTKFSIPWKHSTRHGWEMDKEPCLFKQWSIQTGKYREGQTFDPKIWKSNFLRAMNSPPDIEEVKDKSVSNGQHSAHVFKMLPSASKSKKKQSKARKTKTMSKFLSLQSSVVKTEEESDNSDTLSTEENTVDSSVQTEQQDLSSVCPSEAFEWSWPASPAESNEYDDCEEVIQICKQLESGPSWMPSIPDSTGFLSNMACPSPVSDSSDSSSADEMDKISKFTTLGSDFFKDHKDDIWESLHREPF